MRSVHELWGFVHDAHYAHREHKKTIHHCTLLFVNSTDMYTVDLAVCMLSVHEQDCTVMYVFLFTMRILRILFQCLLT